MRGSALSARNIPRPANWDSPPPSSKSPPSFRKNTRKRWPNPYRLNPARSRKIRKTMLQLKLAQIKKKGWLENRKERTFLWKIAGWRDEAYIGLRPILLMDFDITAWENLWSVCSFLGRSQGWKWAASRATRSNRERIKKTPRLNLVSILSWIVLMIGIDLFRVNKGI